MIDPQIRALSQAFPVDDWPALPCPSCSAGRLTLPDAHEVHDELLNTSTLEALDDPRTDPTALTWVFAARLVCSMTSCREVVAVTGDRLTIDHFDPREGTLPIAGVRISTIYPPVPLFRPAAGTPAAVIRNITRASALIWTDPPAACTCLRAAIEALMTAHEIPGRSTAASGGDRRPINLHNRLQDFHSRRAPADADPDAEPGDVLVDLLGAVKEAGNQGTHDDDDRSALTADDVLDVAGILELALKQLYPAAETDADLIERAKQIHADRGIVR